jgi:hypothetical protein
MSLDAVARQGMPFRGETGGVGAGQGMGEIPTTGAAGAAPAAAAAPDAAPAAQGPGSHDHRHPSPALGSNRAIPLDPDLQARLDAARKAASDHAGHGERRAPRPERLQR